MLPSSGGSLSQSQGHHALLKFCSARTAEPLPTSTWSASSGRPESCWHSNWRWTKFWLHFGRDARVYETCEERKSMWHGQNYSRVDPWWGRPIAWVLVEHMHMLIGQTPEQLSVGLITSVCKAGVKHDPNNCRSNVVMPVLAKLFQTKFAMMLNASIVALTETQKLKAQGQAGYRPNYRTMDNVFILNGLIEHQHPVGCRLHACIVDFKKPLNGRWHSARRCVVAGSVEHRD